MGRWLRAERARAERAVVEAQTHLEVAQRATHHVQAIAAALAHDLSLEEYARRVALALGIRFP